MSFECESFDPEAVLKPLVKAISVEPLPFRFCRFLVSLIMSKKFSSSRNLVVFGSVLDHILVYSTVLIFMIGLSLFYQVLLMLLVDFWPKFTCTIETIG